MAEYIDRDKLRLALKEWQNTLIETYGENDEYVRCIDSVLLGIENAPAADVRPVVKAKWEDVHIDRPEISDLEVASMFCPNCNRWHNEVYHYGNPIEFANFCNFCGADMREES